ncbi:hypothetical protein [Mariniblastus fucicola]|uniref:Cytochrome C n=1 Tax=Mariniblastus fucicola TaxID=980251 RepID=A0A5B9PD87_9BACT|nr:hypothetical protein [Mariniblastus fucicola]QEG23060.1 hypothetical protein MFFC18_29520 [Mariniblastus fucicola]
MKSLIQITFAISLIAVSLSLAVAQEESAEPPKKIRKVQRVAKPSFETPKDDVYFQNIFEDGIVGERPESSSAANMAASGDANAEDNAAANSTGWSMLIDGTTIEDEIKSLNQALAKSVTSPVKFKTAYNDVRQSMSLLSMSFAIIREYDGEVRWKDHAAAAQAALQQAATNARSNTVQAFNYCNARKFDLEDLVRGGSFAEIEKPPEELQWSDVIGRNETMERLGTSDELLKQWTADQQTFSKQRDDIISEAQWVAAIAAVIAQEGMDDADVDEYVAYCDAMKKSALDTVAAAKSDDFEAASKFANLVSQSCNNCHEDWR